MQVYLIPSGPWPIQKHENEPSLGDDEMIPFQLLRAYVILIQKATVPPAAPQVSGRVMHASCKIPRFTHWLIVLSNEMAPLIC